MEEKSNERRPLSEWAQHIMSFVEQDVEVSYYLADKAYTIKGKLRYFNFNKDSCLIETDKEMLWVRTPVIIRRAL
jgi:hypothetical protein